MTELCEYCGDREGETRDRWDGWACRACHTEGEAIWRSSVAGAFADLHDRAVAIGGPIGWWIRRRLIKVERNYRKTTKRALERALGRKLG